MPVKRGNGARRGMNKGLEKARKKGKPDNNNVAVATARNKKTVAAAILPKLAQLVFNSIAYTACFFHVVPMKYHNGVCSLITAKLHKVLYYSVLFFLFARIANIIYVCSLLVFMDFNTRTLVSFTILMYYLLCLSLGSCNILISRDTVQLVNNWRQVLGILGEVGVRPLDMFEDISLSVKIVATGGTAVMGPLILSGIPLVYPELPVSIHYQMKQVLPDLPDIWTLLVCFTFELVASLIACLNNAFGVCVLVISIDLANVFGKFMRRLSLNTAAQHQQMQTMYLIFKVYNACLNVWYKVVVPQALFMASSAIILSLYITFRHTELPTYIYFSYPYVALLTFCNTFGLCYDGLVAINATEETLCRLRSRQTKCFTRMSAEERAAGLKWAKAMKPVLFSVGSFTDFNIAVPVGVLDEILNQLMFLLTF